MKDAVTNGPQEKMNNRVCPKCKTDTIPASFSFFAVVGPIPSISSISMSGSSEVSRIASISSSLVTGEDSFVLLSATLFHNIITFGHINTKKYLGDREGGILHVAKEWDMCSLINLD